jgi:hypothetical protein
MTYSDVIVCGPGPFAVARAVLTMRKVPVSGRVKLHTEIYSPKEQTGLAVEVRKSKASPIIALAFVAIGSGSHLVIQQQWLDGG